MCWRTIMSHTDVYLATAVTTHYRCTPVGVENEATGTRFDLFPLEFRYEKTSARKSLASHLHTHKRPFMSMERLTKVQVVPGRVKNRWADPGHKADNFPQLGVLPPSVSSSPQPVRPVPQVTERRHRQ